MLFAGQQTHFLGNVIALGYKMTRWRSYIHMTQVKLIWPQVASAVLSGPTEVHFRLNRIKYLPKRLNLLMILKTNHKNYNLQHKTHSYAYGVAVCGSGIWFNLPSLKFTLRSEGEKGENKTGQNFPCIYSTQATTKSLYCKNFDVLDFDLTPPLRAFEIFWESPMYFALYFVYVL